jgi:hypothetical protein
MAAQARGKAMPKAGKRPENLQKRTARLKQIDLLAGVRRHGENKRTAVHIRNLFNESERIANYVPEPRIQRALSAFAHRLSATQLPRRLAHLSPVASSQAGAAPFTPSDMLPPLGPPLPGSPPPARAPPSPPWSLADLRRRLGR